MAPSPTAEDGRVAAFDAHAHVWPRWPYQPPVPDDATRGSVEHLLFEMDQNGVGRALVVAAGIDRNPDNNEYVAAAVRAHPDRLVHAADVDCRWTPDYHRPGAADRLRAAVERYGVRVVTHYLAKENDGWLVSDEGRAFFRTAASLGLVLSVAAPPPWHEDLRVVARENPAVPIVVHHLANVLNWPGGVDEGLRLVLPGRDLPNLFVKASGWYYASDEPWEYPHTARLEVARAFHDEWGPHRLVWASDHPVHRRALTYRQTLEIVRRHCTFIDPADLPGVLGGNLAALLPARSSVA